jgi:hypothetical protein
MQERSLRMAGLSVRADARMKPQGNARCVGAHRMTTRGTGMPDPSIGLRLILSFNRARL